MKTIAPTEEQEKIIAHREGPALVTARAGTAKTTTLLLRVKRLFNDRPLSSSDVLLTTFSRLGVADLRKRAGELGLTSMPEIRTLHSIAWKAIKSGGKANWKLPPDWWVRKVLKQAFDQVTGKASQSNYDDDGNWCGKGATPPLFTFKEVVQIIGVAKSNLVRLDAWTDVKGVRHPSFSEWAQATYVEEQTAKVAEACYRALEEARHAPLTTPIGGRSSKLKGFLGKDVACTHDDALLEVAYAILMDAEWIKPLGGSCKHVVVDEAQDQNLCQWVLVRHIAKTFRAVSSTGIETTWQNLMIVCDEQQAIYEWRGARPDLLFDFMATEGHQLSFYPLTMNFRSGQAILDVANKLLRTAKKKLFAGELRCGRPDIEAVVVARESEDTVFEAAGVADSIQAAILANRPPSEIAVLYRMNSQAGLVELELIRRAIPYRVAGRGFFMRPEVDAAIKYIALSLDETDEEAFETIYRLPFRWIKRDFLTEFPTLASLRGKPKGLVSARWKGATRLLKDMDALIVRLKEEGLVAALEYVFDEIGLREHCKRQTDDEEDLGSDDNEPDRSSEIDTAINELLACARISGDPIRFLEFVREKRDQVMVEDPDGEKEDARVTLSTCHKFKGLERDDVYVIGMSPGLFPARNAPLEEERRLAYVALTRARRNLHVSWVENPSLLVYDAGLAERETRATGELDDLVRLELM